MANCDTNLTIEPGTEHVSVDTNTEIDFVSLILDESPRGGDEAQTESAFQDLINQGEDPQALVEAMKAYAADNADNRPRYLKYAQTFLSPNGDWKAYIKRPQRDDRASMLEHAQKVKNWNADRDGPMKFAPALCEILIDQNLLTQADCKKAGIVL